MSTKVDHFEVHQMEGVDPGGRMFSRDLAIDVDEEGYTGQLTYEGMSIRSNAHPTVEESATEVARKLSQKGFTMLRTRLNFREERYLAEREPWVDY